MFGVLGWASWWLFPTAQTSQWSIEPSKVTPLPSRFYRSSKLLLLRCPGRRCHSCALVIAFIASSLPPWLSVLKSNTKEYRLPSSARSGMVMSDNSSLELSKSEIETTPFFVADSTEKRLRPMPGTRRIATRARYSFPWLSVMRPWSIVSAVPSSKAPPAVKILRDVLRRTMFSRQTLRLGIMISSK